MAKQFYKAKDLAEMLEISESKSYDLIRQMNSELEKAGYLVCRGRVPVSYVKKRFFGVVDHDEQARVSEQHTA